MLVSLRHVLARTLARSLILCALFAILALSGSGAGPSGGVERANAAEELQPTILKGFSQTLVNGAYVLRLELIGTPRSRLLLLANPSRVALDLVDTVSAVEPPQILDNPLVGALRQGLVAADRYRLVFSLKQPGLAKADLQTVADTTILTLTVSPSDPRSFAKALETQTHALSDPAPGATLSAPTPEGAGARRFTVVIDPGHGGVDNGAIGPGGTLEKDVNLKFAMALREAISADKTVKVVLTREDDRFIPLDERAATGRNAGADIFISCHADSIRYGTLRGATVYTLSEKASDSLALEIADSENAADRFIGPDWRKSSPEVIDILADLTRRETESFSEHFAAILVDEFSRRDIRLMKNPKRSAGFRVLMASDIPSVLVEMGYLSNADDEKLLADESWRHRTAGAIAEAVLHFLKTRDGAAKSDGD